MSEFSLSRLLAGDNKNPCKPLAFNHRERTPSCSNLCLSAFPYLSKRRLWKLLPGARTVSPSHSTHAHSSCQHASRELSNMPDTSICSNSILSLFQRHSQFSRVRLGVRWDLQHWGPHSKAAESYDCNRGGVLTVKVNLRFRKGRGWEESHANCSQVGIKALERSLFQSTSTNVPTLWPGDTHAQNKVTSRDLSYLSWALSITLRNTHRLRLAVETGGTSV